MCCWGRFRSTYTSVQFDFPCPHEAFMIQGFQSSKLMAPVMRNRPTSWSISSLLRRPQRQILTWWLEFHRCILCNTIFTVCFRRHICSSISRFFQHLFFPQLWFVSKNNVWAVHVLCKLVSIACSLICNTYKSLLCCAFDIYHAVYIVLSPSQYTALNMTGKSAEKATEIRAFIKYPYTQRNL